MFWLAPKPGWGRIKPQPVSTSTSSTDERTPSSTGHPVHPPAAFATTSWSAVLAAGHGGTTQARAALERLCRTYWYPLYACIRRRGHSPADAQDLTQEFFAHLLAHQTIAQADPHLGRFRSYLLTSLNGFLANESRKARARKRGGGLLPLSLDWAAAEERFDLEPADHLSPDKIFDQHWALTLLEVVLNRLAREYQAAGKTELFAALKQTLMGTREAQPYAELGRTLGLNEGAIKVAVHRLRKRYRDLMREEIAATLDGPHDVESEMRHLFGALAAG
jgi:RNA polymerase sigma-70 factor (ECF subfamily)